MTAWIVFQDTPGSGPGGVVVFSEEEAERVAAGQRKALAFRFGREVRVWVERHDEPSGQGQS